MFFLRLRKLARQVVNRNSLRRSASQRRRRSPVECLEPRLVLTVSSYVPAYILEAPLPGVSGLGSFNFPTFGDVDADGDLDLLMGQIGRLTYFQNTGNSTTPVFTDRTGLSDPFAGVTAALPTISLPNPALADWDSDGDLDLALGAGLGFGYQILAFENIGTATTPNFVSRTGTANPFNGVELFTNDLAITFGDLDGDHDLDAVLSSGFGSSVLNYLENQGGTFVRVSGAGSPVAQVYVGPFGSPKLGDLDGDGDLDLVVSVVFATVEFTRYQIQFFENTGTSAAANFGFIPASGTIIGQLDPAVHLYAPALGDLDHDGDQDLLVGLIRGSNGPLQYFRASGDSRNAPVNSVPQFNSTTEDAAYVFSTANFNAISVADANADNSPLEITLAVSHGTLTLSTSSGLVFSIGDGVADGLIKFRGTLSNINAALDGLRFVPDRNYVGEANVTITTNDLGQPGGGVALSDSDRISIRVVSVEETLAELRFWIDQFVSFGDLTAGQGAAMQRNLVLTGDVKVDVRHLQTYLKMAKGLTRGGQLSIGWERIFIKLAEDVVTALLTT